MLAFFFARHGEEDLPVVALVAMPEELARAAGAPSTQALEVRDAFVACVREAIPQRGSLLDDASNYQEWPAPPSRDQIPRFVAHLVFTCIAASESSEDLASENSYLQRLRELCGGSLPDHTLQWLPTLWENLAAWLASRGHDYRPLRLPDPGGHTRIGYSEKLAFPDRRDQRVLSKLLDEAGLLGHEPPVGRIVDLVAAARNQFRRSFLEAFDDFRARVARGPLHARDVVEHRLWSAVRDAVSRGRGATDDLALEQAARFQMLCEEQDDRLQPFVVSDRVIAGDRIATREMSVEFDIWRHAVVRSRTGTGGPEAAFDTARAVFAGDLWLPRLSSLATQGLVPLVDGVHGCLEVAGTEQLEETRTCLVRKDIAEAVIGAFGAGRSQSRPSTVDGWCEITGLKLRRWPAEALARLGLDRCWQLHLSITRAGLRLQGGVRASDGWLGYREILPHVVAPGAREITVERPGAERQQLRKDDAGAWHLPREDHDGECLIEALVDDGSVERRSVRFFGIVGSENIRVPDEVDAWSVEGLGGTGTLSMQAPSTSAPGQEPTRVAERTVYLGPVVGQFVEATGEAAWRVTRFAGRTTGARCRHDLAEETGKARLDDKSARRRWRQLLLNCKADASDEGFAAARSGIRQRVMAGDQPTVTVASRIVARETRREPSAAPEVDRLLSIVVARAGNRTGIPYREWARFVEQVMGFSGVQFRTLTRCWAEAGIIDIGSYARWSHCSIFARAPKLIGFRTERGFGATIMGVTLPITRHEVHLAAKRIGVEIENRCGGSASAPALMTLRTARLELLDDLARTVRMPLLWLDLDLEHYADQCRHDGRTPPPQNYDDERVWRRWSLNVPKDSGGLSFVHRSRLGQPDYWEVGFKDRAVWSYDLNTARSWAASMTGEHPLVASDDTGLLAVHAYLPLPLARFATAIEGATIGSYESGQYQYRISSRELRDRLIGVVRTVFDVRRLPSHKPAMTG